MKILDGIFESPFYRQSQRLTSFFIMTVLRKPNLINDKDMIIRLWNSGDSRLQDLLTFRLRQAVFDSISPNISSPAYLSLIEEGNTLVVPPEVMEEMHRKPGKEKALSGHG